MSECKLNHSVEDVRKKFETQTAFLPSYIQEAFPSFINAGPNQHDLNEVFHYFKKYDLSSESERKVRDNGLKDIFAKYHE